MGANTAATSSSPTEVITLTVDLTEFETDATVVVTITTGDGTAVLTVDPHTMH